MADEQKRWFEIWGRRVLAASSMSLNGAVLLPDSCSDRPFFFSFPANLRDGTEKQLAPLGIIKSPEEVQAEEEEEEEEEEVADSQRGTNYNQLNRLIAYNRTGQETTSW